MVRRYHEDVVPSLVAVPVGPLAFQIGDQLYRVDLRLMPVKPELIVVGVGIREWPNGGGQEAVGTVRFESSVCVCTPP